MSGLLDVRHGIDLLDEYTKTSNGVRVHVYVGRCDGRNTKWITQGPWDFKLRVQMNSDRTDVVYIDSKNQEVIVCEDDDEEWEWF